MAAYFSRLSQALLVAVVCLLGLAAETRAGETGRFAVVSDIHFDPFAAPDLALRLAAAPPQEWPGLFASIGGQLFSPRGKDTNHTLFVSMLAALTTAVADADLVIIPGDLLSHKFESVAATVLGSTPAAQDVRRLASGTALYVAGRFQTALPGRPIILGLGNNDSECGDYRLEPGGNFLMAIRDKVRELAGRDLVSPDFDRTFMAGGYYEMRHPKLPGTTIFVVNDVLWSAEYRNACGTNDIEAAAVMMNWLERRLREERSIGRRAWLVHHIPVGIDPYATLFPRPGSSCLSRITPFLKEPFASRFVSILREFADTIQTSFAGHTHQDGYRLLTTSGNAVGVEKIAPSTSPIFGNYPGFLVFDYDRQSGRPNDFSAWYLANLEVASTTTPGEWRREYVFSQAYNTRSYSAQNVEDLAITLSQRGLAADQAQKQFSRYSNVGHEETSQAPLAAYLCAIKYLDPASYAACYCKP